MATAYPGGLRKRGGMLDEFMAPDYSYLARKADPTPAQNTRGLVDYLRDEYPRIYGAGAGLLQSDPYETANAYGVFDPNRKAAFEAAQLAFPVGLALDAIPGLGALKRPAMAAGRFVAPKAGLLAEEYMQGMGTMPSIVPKAPRMSAAEAEAQGYWHPIGAGKKLPIPVSEMKMELQPIGNLPPKIIASPEKMQGGAITPFSGDRSAAGQNLLGIGNTRFQTPVELQGGYDFMRMQSPTGSVWASEQGAAQSLQNRINEAAKGNSGDVYGVYTAMGPESMNFNTMMSDALLEQMKAGKISKKNIAAFDREVRTLRPEWAGVMSPESRAQLETNGALRHAFVNRMQLDEFQNVGFPNIAYTRYAITDPLLLNEPMYSGGLAIGKMKPDAALITNPISPHKTYDTQLAGEYFGGFEQSVPKEILFPDWYKMRRQIGAPTSGDVRSFQFAKPIQPTNQEWLDNLMNYMGTQKSLLD